MGRRVALEVIDIAEPCTEDWDAMRGDERIRFCGLCHRNVFNLSAMSRDEAEALVAEAEERVCVRMYRRADGTVTTADCAPDRLAAVRRGAKRSLAWAAAGVAGLLAVVGGLGLASQLGPAGLDALVDKLTPEPEPCEVPMMGEAVPADLPPVETPAPDGADDVTEVAPAPESGS